MNANTHKNKEGYKHTESTKYKDITKWSSEDVIQWLSNLSIASSISSSFMSNHINGYDLVNITQEQLKSELSIGHSNSF